MKAALCLLGKVGGTQGKDGRGEPVDAEMCYRTYKEFVIDVNGCDVFFHTWSVEQETELVRLYRPKDWGCEPQRHFEPGSGSLYRLRSKNYSQRQAVLLKQGWERRHGMTYDWVMTGRFDMLCLAPFDFFALQPGLFYLPNLSDFPGQVDRRWRVPPKVNISLQKQQLHDIYTISDSAMIDAISLTPFSQGANMHKALWKHVDATLGIKTVAYYGWRGHEWDLYRYKECHSIH